MYKEKEEKSHGSCLSVSGWPAFNEKDYTKSSKEKHMGMWTGSCLWIVNAAVPVSICTYVTSSFSWEMMFLPSKMAALWCLTSLLCLELERATSWTSAVIWSHEIAEPFMSLFVFLEENTNSSSAQLKQHSAGQYKALGLIQVTEIIKTRAFSMS